MLEATADTVPARPSAFATAGKPGNKGKRTATGSRVICNPLTNRYGSSPGWGGRSCRNNLLPRSNVYHDYTY